MKEYRIICFEGGECSGKSTLKKLFEKETNFRHLCVDRMFITSIVYNRHKNRHVDLEKKLYEDLDVFIKVFNPLFVVLNVEESERERRFVERGDWYILQEELSKIQKIYDEVLKNLIDCYPKNFLILDNNTQEDQSKAIKKIKEMCEEF